MKTVATLADLRAVFEASGGRYPTPLSRELYDRASAEGFDMLGYVVEPKPYRSKITGQMCIDDANGYTRVFAPSSEPRWPCQGQNQKPTWDGTRWSDDDPKTDDEKHAFCKHRTGDYATILPRSLYEAMEREGKTDMRWYVINKPLPEF